LIKFVLSFTDLSGQKDLTSFSWRKSCRLNQCDNKKRTSCSSRKLSDLQWTSHWIYGYNIKIYNESPAPW